MTESEPNGETAEGGRGDEVGGAPDGDARALLALVDRLGTLLDENDLAELEVEAEGTRVVLRRGAAPATAAAIAAPDPGLAVAGPSIDRMAGDEPTAPPAETDAALVAVVSPLTGVFYTSPAPGSAPYVQVGGEVAVGQVIGLVEAMKLFNEIKSQVAGRVVRIVAESGALVKAKQTLIEVEPL